MGGISLFMGVADWRWDVLKRMVCLCAVCVCLCVCKLRVGGRLRGRVSQVWPGRGVGRWLVTPSPDRLLPWDRGRGGAVLWDWADLVPVDCGFELLLLTPLTHAG